MSTALRNAQAYLRSVVFRVVRMYSECTDNYDESKQRTRWKTLTSIIFQELHIVLERFRLTSARRINRCASQLSVRDVHASIIGARKVLTEFRVALRGHVELLQDREEVCVRIDVASLRHCSSGGGRGRGWCLHLAVCVLCHWPAWGLCAAVGAVREAHVQVRHTARVLDTPPRCCASSSPAYAWPPWR